MNGTGDMSALDRMQAWCTGSMPADQRAQFEDELARDPALAQRAQEFRLVWQATAAGLGATTASRTTFDELLARGEITSARATRWRRVAAAVVFACAATAAWFAWRHHVPASDPVVKLRAIPLEAPAPLELAEHAVPPLLANWSPVVDGSIRWLESIDDARAVGSVVGRPIFVYGFVDGCPICQGFQAHEFKDAEILALIDKSVPVRINLTNVDQDEMDAIMARRYPLLEIQDERGDIVRTFGGQFADVDMKAELAGALKDRSDPSWTTVHELANTLQRARSASENEAWSVAAPAFEALVQNRDLPVFAQAGRAGLARAASAALHLIDGARSRAAVDAPMAMATFETGFTRFEGTRFEPDLLAVLDAWRTSGRFPRLEVQR